MKHDHLSDEQFLTMLRNHLRSGDGQIEPATPIFKKTGGAIDRDKTLTLPCYAGLQ